MGNLTMKDVKPLGFKELVSSTLGASDGKAYKPMLNKRILVLSSPPEKINFAINLAKEHPIPALFGKNGKSKVSVRLDRDAYQPSETIQVKVTVDNRDSDQGVKSIKAKLVRQVTAVSANGSRYDEQTVLVKLKQERVIPGK